MSETITTEKFVTYCHIKRSCPPKSNALEKTVCGKEDPGLYVYVTLGRDEQIPETGFPICAPC